MSEAAEIFATREARKRYGRTAHARTCNQNAYAQDGSFSEYNAFIGYTPAGKHNIGTTIGTNFLFSVYVEK